MLISEVKKMYRAKQIGSNRGPLMNIFRKIRTMFTRKWWYHTATEMTPPCPKLPEGRWFWVGSLVCQECPHNLAMGEDFDKGKWVKCVIKNNPKVLWEDNNKE